MDITRTDAASLNELFSTSSQCDQLTISFSESKQATVCRRIMIFFIVCCSLATFITVGAILYLFFLPSYQYDVSEICLTEHCIHTASKIISSMNKSVDPCQDFYQFACGQWINKQIIQPGQTMIDLNNILIQELEERMKNLLSQFVDDEPRYKRLVKIFYNSCLKSENDKPDDRFDSMETIDDPDLRSAPADDVKERERYCIAITRTLFPHPVGRIYVDHYFSENDKKYVNEMFMGISKAFLEHLDENIGFSQTTINLVRQVIKSMTAKIGYPKFIKDDDWLKGFYADWPEEEQNFQQTFKNWTDFKSKQTFRPVENWLDDVANVDALYDARTNAFVLPAGFLQPIVYSGSYTRSMNYGMIGMIIAHEIAHGLEMSVVYSNITERPESDITQFKSRKMCVTDQYGRYEWRGQQLQKTSSSLNENIADTVGLKFSYMAYKNYIIKNGVDVERLPGLDLNHQQLFFLSFAQMWCDKVAATAVKDRVKRDPHAPNIYRVIGPVQNSPDFAEAFQCPLGSPMNPFIKCSIY